MTMTTGKSTTALPSINWPVLTATKAKRKIIKLDASLSRLSPSMIAAIVFGILTYLSTEVAETASGGEMMPPNKKPRAIVKPGIRLLETTAITKEVIITTRNANVLTTRLHFQRSFHEVYQAASNNNGGRKIKKIRSGSKLMTGMPGKMLMIKPATTRRIG